MIDKKQWTLLLGDVFFLFLSGILALFLRLDGSLTWQTARAWTNTALIATLPMVLINRSLGLYSRLWAYATLSDMLKVIQSVSALGLVLYLIIKIGSFNISLGALVLVWGILLCSISAFRLSFKIIHDRILVPMPKSDDMERTLVIGAGLAGQMLVKELKRHPELNRLIVGFLDDDVEKHKMYFHGFEVIGSIKDLPEIAAEENISCIILAIPSAPGEVNKRVQKMAQDLNLKIQTVPALYDLVGQKALISDLRSIRLEDLLKRKPVRLDHAEMFQVYQGKVALVTGAGGSIGAEISRQLLNYEVSTLILLGRGENSIYEINRELREIVKKYKNQVVIKPVICDIRDRQGLEKLFQSYRPQIVFHAAAHKHVPLMEMYPIEAINNNIFGTRNVAELALQYGVERFVQISTDKAVRPTSVMGASKRAAELIVDCLDQEGKTKFVSVRFGNVLGSRGSVVPVFLKQISEGGPVTVTDERMTRYFMVIPEAVELVLQAGSLGQGGEVFVLDMGEPVKIVDMARDLIRFSGFEPDKDIEIVFTGIRPGEKLYEELLTAEEGTIASRYEKLFIARKRVVKKEDLIALLDELEVRSSNNNIKNEELIQLIMATAEKGSVISPETLVSNES
ncbi:MAG: polysaccharide biosynthesis protein [Firmicutes bacterium]|nr:polysaccharide biosynthesis protein [Bacillota bacterium]